MANYAAINNIYNYYLTTYAPKTDSKYDTHKKSELRSVYNSMVKLNTDSPLYIVDKSQETKQYAIGLKENARALRNTIASLGGLKEDELLSKKIAYSSNDSLATVNFVGSGSEAENAPTFDISVTGLATKQENTGKFLPSDGMRLSQGRTYSFDISTNGMNYEFQYTITKEDTNKTVQEKLARLINNANIGLTSSVITNEKNETAIQIQSKNEGTPANGRRMFNVSDNNTSLQSGSVDYFGLSNISSENRNATFIINGNEHEANGNMFTVENMYEITLNRESINEEDSATVGIKPDYESMATNVSKLIDGFNKFIDITSSYTSNHPLANRLVDEMKQIATERSEELSSIGIELREDGRINVDKEMLMSVAENGEMEQKFSTLQDFAGSMLFKSNQVSLNPMNYASKTVAAYKNPGHNYATPYITSNYSGLLFNSYC